MVTDCGVVQPTPTDIARQVSMNFAQCDAIREFDSVHGVQGMAWKVKEASIYTSIPGHDIPTGWENSADRLTRQFPQPGKVVLEMYATIRTHKTQIMARNPRERVSSLHRKWERIDEQILLARFKHFSGHEYLHFSTRRSIHLVCNLLEVNPTHQIHFP